MAKLKDALLCVNSSIDYQDNALSIYGIIYDLRVQGFPALIPNIELIAIWEKENNEAEIFDYKVEIFDPDDNSLFRDIHQIEMSKTWHRQRSRFSGLQISTAGRYRFVVSSKQLDAKRWRKAKDVTLDISLIE